MSVSRTVLVLGILGVLTAGCVHRRTFADRVKTPEWAEFSARVKTYTAIVDQAAKGAPPLPDKATPEQITARKQVLADRIRKARANARPGDIFGGDRTRFVQIIRSEVRGADGKSTKSVIAEDNPARDAEGPRVVVGVNSRYPDGAALSTVPPTLLLRLPTLPENLEYRFVGKTLVLRDVGANLIVDFIPNALI